MCVYTYKRLFIFFLFFFNLFILFTYIILFNLFTFIFDHFKYLCSLFRQNFEIYNIYIYLYVYTHIYYKKLNFYYIHIFIPGKVLDHIKQMKKSK